ncbi:MAG: phospholipid carrier-dependent glycosyltransferase [Pseudomonadales bacterium]|nr:phospholipid carrier-dependent glycosyltransferase [Pseudomonadales bacterium]
MKKFVSKYYPQLLLIILAFSFFTRIYNLHLPEKYVFDEVYHAVTAKLIADNNPMAFEWNNTPPEPNTAIDWLHPPIAKYTQALSMNLLSKNSFGWRFSSAIFGVIAIFLTAKLAYNLFHSKSVALIAALITSLDGLVLTMSRIAMNDIHVTVFILMTLNFYIIYLNTKRTDKKFLFFSAAFSGIAMGTKWSGFFALIIIGFFETINLLITFFHREKMEKLSTKIRTFFKEFLFLFTLLIILPGTIYILSYSQMFLQGKNFNHFIGLHKNIWSYQTSLVATHPAQSKPIEWFLNTKPVWIYANWQTNKRADIYAVGNPILFWISDIFVFISLIYSIFIIKHYYQSKKIDSKNLNFLHLIIMYFAVWIPWQFSPRIMFFYHYLPAVPLLCINTAYWLNKMMQKSKNQKKLAILIIMSFLITFIIWYPHWTGIFVSDELKESLYFALDSWQQK